MKTTLTIHPKVLTGLLLLFTQLALFGQSWQIHTVRDGIFGAWTRPGDFDKDGDPDILVQASDSIFWYENLRPGWVKHLIDFTFFNSALGYVDVIDLDKDGDLDVLKAPTSNTGTDSLTWNENQSNGAMWVKHVLQKIQGALGWMQGSYGDLDKDGDIDLIVPEYDLVNTPSLGSLYWLENEDNTDAWIKHPLKSGSHWYSSVADMDGDGDLDIVGAYAGIFWLENQLPATSWIQHPVFSASENANFIGACIDMNNDGKADIVSAPSETNGGMVYYVNSIWQEVNVNPTGQNLYVGTTGDIDNDGDLDITYGGAGFLPQALGWAENKNNGINWIAHDITPPLLIQMIPTGLADIDGDDDLDIVSLTFDVSTGSGSAIWAANPGVSTAIQHTLNLENLQLKSSPNPFANQTFLEFELKDNTLPLEITVTDILGRTIKSFSIENPNVGINQLPLNINAPAGLLFLTLKQGASSKTIQLAKQ